VYRFLDSSICRCCEFSHVFCSHDYYENTFILVTVSAFSPGGRNDETVLDLYHIRIKKIIILFLFSLSLSLSLSKRNMYFIWQFFYIRPYGETGCDGQIGICISICILYTNICVCGLVYNYERDHGEKFSKQILKTRKVDDCSSTQYVLSISMLIAESLSRCLPYCLSLMEPYHPSSETEFTEVFSSNFFKVCRVILFTSTGWLSFQLHRSSTFP
jgi:hypothetical protein